MRLSVSLMNEPLGEDQPGEIHDESVTQISIRNQSWLVMRKRSDKQVPNG